MTRQGSDSVTTELVLVALVATAVCLSLHVEQKGGRTSEKVSLGNGPPSGKHGVLTPHGCKL